MLIPLFSMDVWHNCHDTCYTYYYTTVTSEKCNTMIYCTVPVMSNLTSASIVYASSVSTSIVSVSIIYGMCLSSIVCASTCLPSEHLLVLPVAYHFSNHKFSHYFHQCENTLYKFAPLTIQYKRIL